MTQDGYGQAYQEGFNLTLRFLRSRGVPTESAREVTQAAWAKGWECLGQLRNEDLVVTWINTIALNAYRRVRRYEDTFHDLKDIGTRPGVNFAAIDMARILKICHPADRALLNHQMDGLTPREIARLRGVPESAIRIRLLRARRSARLRIEQARRAARKNNDASEPEMAHSA
jgi:DNA-directed RNA polymerase specialized sigma24 family protein